jgi:hypothetical protein
MVLTFNHMPETWEEKLTWPTEPRKDDEDPMFYTYQFFGEAYKYIWYGERRGNRISESAGRQNVAPQLK